MVVTCSVFNTGAGEDDHALAAIFIRVEFGAAIDGLYCKASYLQEQADFAIEKVAEGNGRDGALNCAITADFVVNPVDAKQLLGAVKIADRVLHHEMARIRFEEGFLED